MAIASVYGDRQYELSVIVPTLNASKTIISTLNSLSSQGNGAWEYIFIDGGSTDGTIHHLQHFTSTTKQRWQLTIEKDLGVPDAFNKGIRAASGTYLYFLCSGDTLYPNVLQEVLQEFSQQPDLLYAKIYEVAQRKISGGYFPKLENFLRFNLFHQSLFYHWSVFERYGIYNTIYRSWSDYEFNMRCLSSTDIRTKCSNSLVCSYLGGGPSDFGDPVFESNRLSLIRKYFSERYAVVIEQCMRHNELIIDAISNHTEKGKVWCAWGAGSIAVDFLNRVTKRINTKSFLGFIDISPDKIGGILRNCPIQHPSILKQFSDVMIIVTISESSLSNNDYSIFCNYTSLDKIFIWK